MKKRIASVIVALLVFCGTFQVGFGASATDVPIYKDASQSVNARVSDLLSRMTLAEKIGQMTQTERLTSTPDDVKNYYIGSVLSGGGSDPTPNTAAMWAETTDSFQKAAMSTDLGIPILYGADTVHGNSNVQGATIFPHDIGLAATRDTGLVQNVGAAVAQETRATGVTWGFAPDLAVVHNERWGRTYESFGENTDLVSQMASAYIKGLSGGSSDGKIGPQSIVATPKHYIGEGLTTDGVNQGNAVISDYIGTTGDITSDANKNTTLVKELLGPYKSAIQSGAQSIMVSYNSINGTKCSANADLITNVLKTQLGFKGIVVSDWEALAQLPGATADQKSQGMDDTEAQIEDGINAGIDIAMVPNSWKTFITDLTDLVNKGFVSTDRINDAVTRILTVKFNEGLFENPYSDPSLLSTVGSSEHRVLAEKAVSESLVLLKNDNNVVGKLGSYENIFVAGRSADDIGMQCGGWTITWQGSAGDTTTGTTILQGIESKVSSGTNVSYNKHGIGADAFETEAQQGKAVAVVAVGENPYAETNGDTTNLDLSSEDVTTINNIKSEAPDLPIVLVLVAGRPLTISNVINNVQGLVMAWLPGTEGEGVADVLFGDQDFTGALPISWPWYISDLPDPAGNNPMFAYGYGLKKGQTTPVPPAPSGPTYTYQDISGTQGTVSKIEAESFAAMSGIQVETHATYSDVGYFDSGDWLDYYVNVEKAGTYAVTFNVASSNGPTNGALQLMDSDGNILCSATAPNTGDWQSYQTVTAYASLKQGDQKIRLTGNGGCNTDWFEFEPYSSPSSQQTGTVKQAGAVQVTMSSESNPKSQGWYYDQNVINSSYRALEQETPLDIDSPVSSDVTAIKVDQNKEYQTVLGIGTSLEESTVANLAKMDDATREKVLTQLVGTGTGDAGISLIRICIGTPDFTSGDFYTYDDMPSGQTDTSLSHFSIQNDIDNGLIATVKEALQINPNLKIFASPWTPPGWMKEATATNSSYFDNSLNLKGGKLNSAYIPVLAKYYAKYVEAYKEQGINIYAMTMQNEPQLEINYPSCSVSSSQEKQLAIDLSAELKSSGLDTQLWAYDHNFDSAQSYVTSILDDSKANSAVSGVAFHDYSGDPSAMTAIHNLFPDKQMHLTERSVWGTAGMDRIAQYFRNWATSYNAWVTMLNSDISPTRWVGTPDPTMIVQNSSNANDYWMTPEFYLTAQYSKFVEPGAVRIDSNYGSALTVTNVAFKNPDGSIIVVVINETQIDQQFKLEDADDTYEIPAQIPAGTVATFVWTPQTGTSVSGTPSVSASLDANPGLIDVALTNSEFNQSHMDKISVTGAAIDNGSAEVESIGYVDLNHAIIHVAWKNGTSYYNDMPLTVSVPSSALSDPSTGTLSSVIQCADKDQSPTAVSIADGGTEIDATTCFESSGVTVSSDTNDGNYLSGFDVGSYCEYQIAVPKDGDYTVTFRVDSANGAGNAIRLWDNGENIRDFSIPKLYNDKRWVTIKDTFHFTAGQHTLRLVAGSSGFDLNWIYIAPKSASVNISGSNPVTVSGDSYYSSSPDYSEVIEAPSGMQSYKYPTCIDFTVDGSWVDYSVNVPVTGTYQIVYDYSGTTTNASAVLKMDDEQLSEMALPSTSSWDTYTASAPTNIHLTAGAHTLQVYFYGNGFNLEDYTISFVSKDIVDAPVFSLLPGTYTGSQTVTLTSKTAGAAVYYTTDGTEPTAASTLYTGPITVSATEAVKAVAIVNGVLSPVASASYTIEKGVKTGGTTPQPIVVSTPDKNGSYTAQVPGISGLQPSDLLTFILGNTTIQIPVSDVSGTGSGSEISQTASDAATLAGISLLAPQNVSVSAGYELSLTNSGSNIHELNAAATVTITLTAEQVAAIENGGVPALYYYDPVTKTLVDMKASFDLTAKTATFTTNHFSTYILALKASSSAVSVSYSAHVQHFGWMDSVSDGQTAGTIGKALRAEAVKISLMGNLPSGAKIIYQAQVQHFGWMNPVSDGAVAGTSGRSLRLEALRITLSGLAGYEVQYRAYVQGRGWLAWQTTQNGTALGSASIAGTVGKSLRLEAIQVRIEKVG